MCERVMSVSRFEIKFHMCVHFATPIIIIIASATEFRFVNLRMNAFSRTHCYCFCCSYARFFLVGACGALPLRVCWHKRAKLFIFTFFSVIHSAIGKKKKKTFALIWWCDARIKVIVLCDWCCVSGSSSLSVCVCVAQNIYSNLFSFLF